MRQSTASGEKMAALVPLLSEMGDLKRIRAAVQTGTHAEGIFGRSWASLLRGESIPNVARREAAAAVAAARLGARDFPALHKAGLSKEEASGALATSFDSVAGALPGELEEPLRAELFGSPVGEPPREEELPPFARLLTRQPRAGATAPGRPRIMVEPPESHADHCSTVALYAVLLAPLYGAEPGVPFLLGLSHHLHNAFFPDSGFAGDELLGERLAEINTRLADRALEEVGGRNPRLRDEISHALPLVGRADSPEARAFQAADVLDRVLQMRHHARAASFTLEEAMGEMELVHEGPTQTFHLGVLDAAGLP